MSPSDVFTPFWRRFSNRPTRTVEELKRLLEPPVLSLPDETRFSGHWVIAPPGRGKTTLLHTLIADDLEKDAAIVLMDSKGDLIEPIKRLQSIKDRLLLIEPNPDSAFALNPLDVTNTNVTQAVSLIEYIMAGLLDAKFTALQSTLFRNVVPAIIEAIPNPTLDDFKLVMVKGLPSLDKVNPHARRFFENRDTGFHSKTYDSTRKEVVWRLDYLLTNPTLRSMFSATHTRLDMGAEMDTGKVIVINNSKAILGDEGAEFFGRFFVALIARAAQQRAGKPQSSKKPCYVYIDECQSVIAKDTRIPVLLDECRSQKIALILSHQRTAQLTPPVLDAVANCAIRMANSDDEAKYLSDKLRMSADTLRSLPRGTFGTFVRDLTPAGIQLRVSKIDLDALPTMTDEELAAIRERMRSDFASSPPSAPPPKDEPIVNFNSRPPEMEPWRLDTADRPAAVPEDDFQRTIKERFETLPMTIQDAIRSPAFEQQVHALSDKLGFDTTKCASLENEIMLVLLGFQTVDMLPRNLKSVLDLSEAIAQALAADISETVIKPIQQPIKSAPESNNTTSSASTAAPRPTPGSDKADSDWATDW